MEFFVTCSESMQHENGLLRGRFCIQVIDTVMVAGEGFEPPTYGL